MVSHSNYPPFSIEHSSGFKQFNEELLENIEKRKTWKFVNLDQITLNTYPGPLRRMVDNANRAGTREGKIQKRILNYWGLGPSTLFQNSTRNLLKEVYKVVTKYPVYKDARARINNLVIERLTDKNSKPTPQKVFTRTGDWTKVASNEVSEDPIPYEVLLKLNIHLGPYNVLESGPPPPRPPPPIIDPLNKTTSPEIPPLNLNTGDNNPDPKESGEPEMDSSSTDVGGNGNDPPLPPPPPIITGPSDKTTISKILSLNPKTADNDPGQKKLTQPQIESGFTDLGRIDGVVDKPEVQGRQIPYFLYHVNTNISVINTDTQIISSSSQDTPQNRGNLAVTKRKIGDQGEGPEEDYNSVKEKKKGEETYKDDNLLEESTTNTDKVEDENPTGRYKRTCQCPKVIPTSILKDLEKEGIITMIEALSTWGTIWKKLGWEFCSQHLSMFADHLKLVDISKGERLERLNEMWKNRDPQALHRLVIKNVEWFEAADKVWIFGDTPGVNVDPTNIRRSTRKRQRKD